MRLATLTICTILLSINIYPQRNESPRREITVAAERVDVLKTDGFKIDFPARPTRTVSTIDTAFGKTNMVNYQLATNLVYYGVTFIDFPTVISDKAEIDLRFDGVKAALLKNAESRLISETEIFFGDNPGREYVIEDKLTTATIRGLFIKQRFFQLTVVTKGKLSRATQRLRDFNHKTVEKFINSFSVTELPTPKTTAVELPKNFGIKIDGSFFTSDFFRFSVRLPENWNIVKEEQADLIKDLSVQDTEDSTEKLRKSLDLSLNNTEILLFMTKSNLETSAANNAVFAIAAEKVSFPNFLPLRIAENYLKTFLDNGEKILKTPSSIKLGGADFVWVETENVEKKFKQRLYVANRKGIAFQLLLNYRNDVELKIMLDCLQTIRFSEDKLEK